QSTMRVLFIVMLKPQLQITYSCLRVRPIGQTSIATFERLHKALGHAVALQAFYLCSEEFESQLLCTDYRFNGGINCAALPAAKRYSIACIIKSLPGPEAIPLVVATQLMTLRSLQSRAKATRTFSPLSQDSSKPSEQQRIIVAHQAAGAHFTFSFYRNRL
ncbi:MAG TPA: hypothetical protein VFX23_14575, partial [Limnobacter sp.]|uniref:hypothetical protein n=1 Tax=Limnobacter sp. TaxID=2003368 RepID=UPI002E31CDA6